MRRGENCNFLFKWEWAEFLCKKTSLHCLATWHTVEVVVERCQISELRNMKIGRREILMWRFSTKWGKWKMTSRKVTATEWIVNENKLLQAPLVAWHVLSSIWVHFGTWGLIFLVKNQFSHIFPASAWSPFLSVILTDKLAGLGTTLQVWEMISLWF